ncbi:hypothetical protein LSH36_537g02070 [Paralvinella palmiformis]|uniref:SUEL-type lectin domain-containing protein n=1 Tax=Paralvinella palmiformis TaxID=53620 RepID=A0AAD9J7W5_9ANNE|nr:hypothetical protein LSH36_537g02070 [Paralvinella palmiformis]
MSCNDSLVINITWSRIGKSDYWELDPERHNCSVTNNTCYKDVHEPADICDGLPICSLKTCNNLTRQNIPCLGNDATNFLRVNYTCVQKTYEGTVAITSAPSSSSEIIVVTTSVLVAISTIFVILTIVIIKRKKLKNFKHDHKQTRNSVTSDVDEFGTTITDNVNYATVYDVIKDANSSCVGRTGITDSSIETSIVDNVNYVSCDLEYNKKTLHPIKGDFNTDTELIENTNYVGFGKQVSATKGNSNMNYELAGSCHD